MKHINQLIEETPNRILFIQQHQRGDVLISSAVVARLSKEYPDAQIDVLTEKMCGDVFVNNPHVTNLWLIDKKKESNLFSQIAFYRKVAKTGKYDVVISLQNRPRCLLQVIFSGAKYKIGVNSKRWIYNICYTHLARSEYSYIARHKVDYLAPLGIKSNEDDKPEWYVSDDELHIADKLLKEEGYNKNQDILFSVDPTHRHDSRRYPTSYYAFILNNIKREYPNAKFFFIRGPGEEWQVEECIKLLDDKTSVIFPKQCPTMRISGAIVSKASYHIGNCSFPRHLAVALDIPSSIFVGPSEYIWAIPLEKHKEFKLGIDCQPCTDDKCPEMTCMINMKPETIIDELLLHIKEHVNK